MRAIYMKRAVELAEKGIGFVNPDPLAGAVIIKNNRIIGEGWYRGYGMETAELEALRNAEEELCGAELYLNIEPSYKCSVIAEAIIISGIKKVYMGILNPDIQSKGKSVEILKSAGIEVETGILKEQCEELNEISIHFMTEGTPFVIAKWAMTLDGKLATRTGDSKWISSGDSLRFVHHIRQRVSAIMVGENTVRLDNPTLSTRLENLEISNPLRLVLSMYGEVNPDANVLKVDENIKTLIIASENISMDKEDYLLNKGVEILKLAENEGRLQFLDIVTALGKRGIDSILIEGGSGVLASAFESGVVNKVYAVVAPKIIGGKEAPTPVGGSGVEKMRDAVVLKNVTHEISGQDVIFKGYV